MLASLTSRQVLKSVGRRNTTANSPSAITLTTNPHSSTALSTSGFHQSLDIIFKNNQIFGKQNPPKHQNKTSDLEASQHLKE